MSMFDLISTDSQAEDLHPQAAAGVAEVVAASTTTPHARTSDPQTSKDAAESIVPTLGAQCERVLKALHEIERTNSPGLVGATVSELAMRLAYDSEPAPQRNIISRRLTDLEQAGLVEVAVDEAGPLTRLANTGRFQQVWRSVA